MKNMTAKKVGEIKDKNLFNIKRCPRYNTCSIPFCPMDNSAGQRTELREDEKCILLKLLGKNKTNRMKGNISPKMKSLLSFIGKNN